MSLQAKLAEVRAQILAICASCGRDPESVELLAVSKTRPAASVREALAAGQQMFGENRVQELCSKAAELEDVDVAWHMIGSVQTNKVRDLVGVRGLALLHSVDRQKLAARLQAELDEVGRDLPVLLQVNATGEAPKHGVEPTDAPTLAQHVLEEAPRLTLRGLMAMGPLSGDPAPVFARVVTLRDELQDRFGVELPVLSMGMTADLEAAIAAGATMVRVGTGVFGPRR